MFTPTLELSVELFNRHAIGVRVIPLPIIIARRAHAGGVGVKPGKRHQTNRPNGVRHRLTPDLFASKSKLGRIT